jgi:hypothetical protein
MRHAIAMLALCAAPGLSAQRLTRRSLPLIPVGPPTCDVGPRAASPPAHYLGPHG